MTREAPEAVRPPVAFGCFVMFAVAAAVVSVVTFGIIFLESGADTGRVRLDVPEAYARGSIEYVGTEQLFIVRLPDGEFLALDDLDAANRANQGRRCRAAIVEIDDPAFGGVELGGRMSAQAAGAKLVLRENCNGVAYDIAGARLTGDGRNLDRYEVTVGKDGHLVVDTTAKVCSQRAGASVFSTVKCE